MDGESGRPLLGGRVTSCLFLLPLCLENKKTDFRLKNAVKKKARRSFSCRVVLVCFKQRFETATIAPQTKKTKKTKKNNKTIKQRKRWRKSNERKMEREKDGKMEREKDEERERERERVRERESDRERDRERGKMEREERER
jgi:hypothetical protein